MNIGICDASIRIHKLSNSFKKTINNRFPRPRQRVVQNKHGIVPYCTYLLILVPKYLRKVERCKYTYVEFDIMLKIRAIPYFFFAIRG